ncbi:N-acyl-D-amino-acid deacylase family protein [Nakamurella lactea]|uniref:N-acyl-D-amino-acid deacylase family protein n=1 Tax=Nakamurella lactea TaxID=459515 RepID=UPI001B7FA9CF|nr:D-aminoacylase [Nakamurella lactea]
MTRTALLNAEVADGSGGPLRRCDVLIGGEQISAVVPAGDLTTAGATAVDCTGLVLSPGFVDVHSHADNAPLLDEPDLSKILQGVTTEVVGNCGFSLAPRGPVDAGLDALLSRIFPPLDASWRSVADLYRVLDERGYITNMAPLVGHHALRILAMGMVDAAPNERELRAMADGLSEAMQAGAFGLSTGLIYPPGMFSRTEELSELAGCLPEHGIYVSHIRGEGNNLMDSIREAIRIGRDSGRRVQVSHLKAAGQPYHGTVAPALAELDAARSDGVDINHDVYPYTASSTMMTALLPPWFQEGGDRAVLARLADPADRERAGEQIANGPLGTWENMAWAGGWSNIVVASTGSGQDVGRSVADIADDWSCGPFDAVVRMLTRERLRVSMVVHQMDEADLQTAMRHPRTMIGSDGLPPGTGGKPHPRTSGTFPRILARYVRDEGVLTLPEAVRRMTSLPAETFRLPRRGRVEPGYCADLVLFDAAAVLDRADYVNPMVPPAGISAVYQGGKMAVRDGQFLGGRPGRRLRPDVPGVPAQAMSNPTNQNHQEI